MIFARKKNEMSTRKFTIGGGCLGTLATGTLFALVVAAPPGGPEGLMGLGRQLAWLGKLGIFGLVGGAIIGMLLARLATITPPPLQEELDRGDWRRHSARAYAAGVGGALLGAGVYGLGAFAAGFIAAAFIAPSEQFAVAVGLLCGGAAAAYGAIWCGRRALWMAQLSGGNSGR